MSSQRARLSIAIDHIGSQRQSYADHPLLFKVDDIIVQGLRQYIP